jgi:hypothetical protein
MRTLLFVGLRQTGAQSGTIGPGVAGPSQLLVQLQSDHCGDMQSTLVDPASLYNLRKGEFAIVDVPELGYLTVQGEGAPGSDEFSEAVAALYAVSNRAHSILKDENGYAPRVMALEAQWPATDPPGRAGWSCQVMIMQPPQVDASVIDRATAEARARGDLPALGRLRYQRWREGLCAQVLHLGPHAHKAASVAWLHLGIDLAGYRPCGRHHEIYLGDPRYTAPQRLRTILRYPIEPLPG